MNAPNVRPDILRTGAMSQQANMLSMGPSPFMQNQMAQPQPPLGPNPMVMPPNPNNPNQPMGMLPQGPNNSMVTPSAVQRYMPNATINQQQRQGPPLVMRNQASQPGLPQSAPPLSGSPMTGLGPNQLGGMGFPSSMMQGQAGPNITGVRRVASQPTMNPGNMPNMPPNMANSMAMSMNPMHSMPAQIRQVRQQQQQQQHQQPGSGMPQQPMGGMVNEMSMPLGRQPPNPGMQQNMAMNINKTAPSPQVMSSLQSQPQPPSLGGPHLAGMQPHHHPNFQNPQLPPQHQTPQMSSSSPRPVSHTPNMSMGTPGPSHTPVNMTRGRMTPDNNNGFMGFPPNYQASNPSRMASTYPMVPSTSSTPPIDIQGGLGPGQSRPSFPLTPAQQLGQMQQAPSDGGFGNQFGSMPPPSSVPPRPPSQHKTHPMQQPPPQAAAHHHSPLATDHMNSQPQRPQSQQSISGRPPSAQNRTHTPRAPPQQLPGPPPGALPGGGLTSIGRIPIQTQPPPQVQSAIQGTHHPIAPRPPMGPQIPGPSNTAAGNATQASSDTPPSNASVIPRPQVPLTLAAGLGHGLGLIRLLQFSGVLSSENNAKLQLSWWNDLIQRYFTSKAVMKFTLWKDNQRNEAKPFEIGVPILPRFFLVTTQSGVKSMTLSLDGARERLYNNGHAVVECVTAVWTYKYTNGYTVTLRGPLTCHVVLTAPPSASNTHADLKFDDFQFDANCHDKYIALESIIGSRIVESPKTPRTRNAPTPTPAGSSAMDQQREEDKRWEEPRVLLERGSIPGEPVNAFGIPQATMRCLELAESVGAMGELIAYATEASLGPKDALREFAAKLREQQGQQMPNGAGPGQPSVISVINGGPNPNMHHPFPPFPSANGGGPPVTLYSSAPPSVTNPPPPNTGPQPSGHSPQNGPPSAVNSPQKQHKTIPQTQSASSSVTAASPAVSTSTATNTPAMANATLKRKQASDTSSPTTGPSEQPATKRPTRGKKGRAGG